MDRGFKSLKRKWYAKLRDEGFDEIEDTESPREMLKCWHSSWFKSHATPVAFVERQRYFQMTSEFLITCSFSSKFEHEVWSYHSEGLSCREIATKVGSNKDKVNQTVTCLVRKMRNGF